MRVVSRHELTATGWRRLPSRRDRNLHPATGIAVAVLMGAVFWLVIALLGARYWG